MTLNLTQRQLGIIWGNKNMAYRLNQRDLGKLDFTRMGRGINTYNPSPDQVHGLLKQAESVIGGLTSEQKVLAIYNHNPESIFVLCRSSKGMNEPEGFLAQLPLNAAGHLALFSGELDTADPDLRYICRQHEIPSAIYSWCIFVNPRIAGGISLVFERFSSPKNCAAPIYCRATNENARRFFLSIGFEFNASYQGITVPELMAYARPATVCQNCAEEPSVPVCSADDSPAYDSAVPSRMSGASPHLGVGVVHSMSELMEVTAIRAATYMAEHNCPYVEEFDGNDFSCTHLLGRVGESPSGCLRIRFFSSFAKIERLAVVKSARHTRLADHLINAAIELCRKKGYCNIYGHSDEKVVALWKRHGFQPRTGKATFSFSGLQLIEGDLKLDQANDVIDLQTDPMIINRPEGQWHRSGVLESRTSSAGRPS